MRKNNRLTNQKIYLDYAASTPVDQAVLQSMEPYFSLRYGNPGSLHYFGQEAIAAVDQSRETIAQAINADFREIIFTGSATEANNLVLRGVVRNFWWNYFGGYRVQGTGYSRTQKFNPQPSPLHPHIIISAIEHESILETARDMEKRGVAEFTILPVNKNGIVDIKKLQSALNDRTVLVSVMYANNEIGTIQPIAEISEIIRNFRKDLFKNSLLITHYPLLHCDAVQAFQFLDCNVQKIGVDLMTLSAHKIYGPKGVGALYIKNPKHEVRNPKQISPFGRSAVGRQNSNVQNISNFEFRISNLSQLVSPIVTGGGQEFGLRSGTENVPAIVGFAKAVALTAKNRKKVYQQVAGLQNYFLQELLKINNNIQINGISKTLNPQPSTLNPIVLPHILNMYFPKNNSQDLLIKLDMAGIAVSSGSACSMRSSKLSHVLKALNYSPTRIQNSLRFSFGKFTTKQEIQKVLKIMREILKKDD